MSEPGDYASEMHEARFRNDHPHWSERDFEEYFHPENTDEPNETLPPEESTLPQD